MSVGTREITPREIRRGQQLCRRGAIALRAGRIDDACELLFHALDCDPKNAMAWLWLSGTLPYIAQQRYCLEQVLLLQPNHPAAMYGMGVIDARLSQQHDDTPVEPPALVTKPQPRIGRKLVFSFASVLALFLVAVGVFLWRTQSFLMPVFALGG